MEENKSFQEETPPAGAAGFTAGALFSPKGRLRGEYYALIVPALLVVLIWLARLEAEIWLKRDAGFADAPAFRVIFGVLVGALCLILLWWIIVATSRRLHDVGLPGWLTVLYLTPVPALWMIAYLVLSLLPSSRYAAAYGPRSPAPAAPVRALRFLPLAVGIMLAVAQPVFIVYALMMLMDVQIQWEMLEYLVLPYY